MTDVHFKALVYNTRTRENSNDVWRILERTLLSMIEDSNFSFLQFNQLIFNNETRNVDRIMVHGNPSLFETLAGEVQLHIDGTLRIYTSQFYQRLIIMVFDL